MFIDTFASIRDDLILRLHALRSKFSGQAALAWALYRNGEFAEAHARMSEALASGAKSAHLFSQAAAVYRAVGSMDEAERYAQAAAQINPRHRSFHIHR